MLTLFLIAILSGCGFQNEINHPSDNEARNKISHLSELKHTEIFREGALKHIFIGDRNRHGDAVGYHYKGFPNAEGETIPGTETQPDSRGVYEAEVTVNGVEKQSNRGKSTFFPKTMTPQETVDAINEAYANKVFIQGNTYEGLSDSHITIRMYLDQNEKIISAFPVYEEVFK